MILLVFHLVFSFVFIIPRLSYGADTLHGDQSLSGNQTLISKDGNFEMGFFRPGKSPNYYIGIWYNKIKVTQETIVWVANRNTPVSDIFFSKLKIIDGNMVLLNESNNQIWSTNMTSIDTDSVSIVLLDDGNLVLKSGSRQIWQSFDHPAHTFLPGSKLGYNKRTNTKNVITSWRAPEDPGVGLFSLEFNQNENQFVLKRNSSVEYWSSGPWNGQSFSSMPEMRRNYIFSFSYVDNVNESYFTYSLFSSSIISKLVMDVSGQVQQTTWFEATNPYWALFWSQPKQLCQIYAYCGPFGVCGEKSSPLCNCLAAFEPRSQSDWDMNSFSSGCVRKSELNCRVKDEIGFIVSNVPDNSISSFLGNEALPLDESACRRSCLDDSTCHAYSFIFKCRIWNSEHLKNISLEFLSANSSVKKLRLNIKVVSKDLQEDNHKKKNTVKLGVVVGAVGGTVFVLGLVLLIIYWKKRILVEKTTMEGSLISFVYKDLKIATKDFSNKLGGGGFGSVFKGALLDSSIVAVKRLESINQGEKQFRSEVSTIGTIQHVNLVRLRGFCAQGNNKLLVYEYMPNGSLDSHLFHEKQVLSWKMRYEIALGTARGLVYLHEKCRDCIIHCDIKPENILLDADFKPKIADFGMAKLVGRDFSKVLTTMRGTRGYLAPEWISGVAVTAKADVFSFGMMLFELVQGKRNSKQSEDLSFTFFPSLAASVLMVGGDILSLVDSRLSREAVVEEVSEIFKVAYWCIQDDEDSRPSMSQVEHILDGVTDVNMPPIPQSVLFFVDNMEHALFFKESFSDGSSQLHGNSRSGDERPSASGISSLSSSRS